MEETSISVNIGNRVYPLKTTVNEVEIIKAAAQLINQLIESFETSYKITDKQDLYSMCLIQIATEHEKQKSASQIKEVKMHNELDNLLATVNKHLTKNVL